MSIAENIDVDITVKMEVNGITLDAPTGNYLQYSSTHEVVIPGTTIATQYTCKVTIISASRAWHIVPNDNGVALVDLIIRG